MPPEMTVGEADPRRVGTTVGPRGYFAAEIWGGGCLLEENSC
jgi:hypothetical protein